MKIILTCILSFCILVGVCQNEIVIDKEQTPQGIILYATNSAYCPVTAQFNFTLENLSSSSGGQNVFVIPAKAQRFKLIEFKVIEHKKWGYSYKFESNSGDKNLTRYDSDYVYELPFRKGKDVLLFQGYNGSFSHQNENALDFKMPEGTEVLAARDGIVVKVIQNFSVGCLDETCKKNTNLILIYHSDGTFASYAHIQFNGAKVKEGDIVKAGELIALSGMLDIRAARIFILLATFLS